MRIPAHAFAEVYPKDLPLGSVFKFRRNWAMLVGYEEGVAQDLLLLTGDRAGQLLKLGHGMPKCPAVVAPFIWFPAVDEGTEPANADHRTTTLTLTNNGLVIIGADMESGDSDYYAFRPNGLVDRDYQVYGSGLRFTQWSAELAHRDQPFTSLGQLFRIEAPNPSAS